ncbi:tRNA pseudouridine(38-40) synthase TruA [Haliangium ochraceum]|uniref:tRNA pseudouridine synthase A n=1 Tax=Haliangium ochraceum (strain DSM 14365 / JCM 11303 / SMP-2) TaxID=502025 RepID=D0LWH9_HALO1|nr:tRNA pseudouridine(38-40) synthase TruA [Haliangium ochraceum]ACY17629.1 tRNA pseudouridine synthase A [Haliangium ochraceum DSM 14365]
MSTERTIRLVLEYDGTGLSGWQRQNNAPTVQAHVEDALSSMLGRAVQIVGASRTDAGVHALGQVAHFRTGSSIPPHGFLRGLNGKLPPAIAVVACAEVRADFHARFDSRGKHYRYALHTRAARAPLLRERAWHCPRPLDLAAMERAAQAMLGERDFQAFRASGCTAKTSRRRVDRVALSRPAADLIHIDVYGNAFLRNMVRIMAGTLVDVGLGRLAADEISSILDSRDRTCAGRTAPAHGLTLVEVFYPAETPSTTTVPPSPQG